MSKVNVDEIPWTTWKSPKGKFGGSRKDISLALGAADAPVGAGGHPFELILDKLMPGEISCPFHSHAAQWELFYIMSGSGTVRLADENLKVRPGDFILHAPGEAHQITNDEDKDLTYLIIADNPSLDLCNYPDSDKWRAFPSRRFYRTSVDAYWDGEE